MWIKLVKGKRGKNDTKEYDSTVKDYARFDAEKTAHDVLKVDCVQENEIKQNHR